MARMGILYIVTVLACHMFLVGMSSCQISFSVLAECLQYPVLILIIDTKCVQYPALILINTNPAGTSRKMTSY